MSLPFPAPRLSRSCSCIPDKPLCSDPLCKKIAHLSAPHLRTSLRHNVHSAVSVFQNLLYGLFHGVGLFVQIKTVAQHHGRRQYRGDRIGDILTGDIRCGAVTRLIKAEFRII